MEAIINATGRRKSAVARVFMREGKGNIIVNDKNLEVYFPETRHQVVIKQPLELLNLSDKFDIKVNVYGGGITGQAEAIRLGIARALVKYNENLKPELRKAGYLTRDPREKERQKPGQPRARKQNQFSKR